MALKNTDKSYGARLSQQRDFSDLDPTPMQALNGVRWKSVKESDSSMPPPVHRYRSLMGNYDKSMREATKIT